MPLRIEENIMLKKHTWFININKYFWINKMKSNKSDKKLGSQATIILCIERAVIPGRAGLD